MTSAPQTGVPPTYVTVFQAKASLGFADLLVPLSVGALIVVILGLPGFRRRMPGWLRVAAPILAVGALVVSSAASIMSTRLIATDLATHHYALAEGPVSEVNLPHQSASGFVGGSFVVDGRRFGLPNYVVTKGFDNQGDAIEPGHVVRIAHDGEMILRVELRQ